MSWGVRSMILALSMSTFKNLFVNVTIGFRSYVKCKVNFLFGSLLLLVWLLDK